MMSNRVINLKVRITPEEQEIISEKIGRVGEKNISAYIRRLVLTGHVIEVDMSDFRELRRLVSIESNNLNQYARRANETGSIYKADIESLQKSHKELIRLLGEVLDKFNNMQ